MAKKAKKTPAKKKLVKKVVAKKSLYTIADLYHKIEWEGGVLDAFFGYGLNIDEYEIDEASKLLIKDAVAVIGPRVAALDKTLDLLFRKHQDELEGQEDY